MWMCKLCSHSLKSTSQVDHIVPLFDGGSNDMTNLEILCVDCHSKKTQMEVERQQQKSMFSIDPLTRSIRCEVCKLVFSRYFPVHKCSQLSK